MSKQTISRITDKVIEEMNDWAVRPLDEIYPAIFIDAIVVKVRDGQVGHRPIYADHSLYLPAEKADEIADDLRALGHTVEPSPVDLI